MIQFPAIVKNSFLQAVRQPVFGIIVIVTLGGLALAPSMTGWTLDDDNKMLRDIGLSTLLVQGIFLACFCASNVIDQEIADRTALTVVAKPVSREVFILGKYVGILLAHLMLGQQSDAVIHQLLLSYQAPKNFSLALCRQYAGAEILRRLLGLAQLPLQMNLGQKQQLLAHAREMLLSNVSQRYSSGNTAA